MSKAQLYDLYSTLENANSPTSKKVTKAHKTKHHHVSLTSSSSRSSSGSPRVSGRSRPSASLGHAPDSAAPSTALPPLFQPITAAPSAATPHATAPTGMTSQSPILSTLPSAVDASLRLPLLAAQAQPRYFYPFTSFPHQWPAAPAADAQVGHLQPATQAC